MKMENVMQRQDSVRDQLRDLSNIVLDLIEVQDVTVADVYNLAVKYGMYDAADAIRKAGTINGLLFQ